MKIVEVEARQVKRGDQIFQDRTYFKVLEVRPPGRSKKISWPHLGLLVADASNYRADGKTLLTFMPKDKVRIAKGKK